MLFMHYSDKLHELSQVIKIGFQYIDECKRQVLQNDECLICGDNFESFDNINAKSAHEDQWFRTHLKDDKTKKSLDCGHDAFHKACITKWLRVKP